MNDRVLEFESNGHEVQYLRYSARVPAFLLRFPPEQGYAVVSEMTDILALQKGRLSLLTAAINAGRKLSDIGLPGIDRDLNKLVCRVKLVDPHGKVVRDASASMDVTDYKDYETLETAAHQRLLASLGFGGEMFDDDEDHDVARQQHEGALGGSTLLPGSSVTRSLADSAASTEASAQLPHATDAAAEEVPDAMRRQVVNLANRLGEAVPEMKTRADAQAALARLGKLNGNRRSASVA